MRGAARRGRRGRQLHRHRRRLRRRPQRAAGRAAAPRAAAASAIYVATKAGRRLPAADGRGLQPREPHGLGRAQPAANLETDAIDLLQLHCPHPGRLRPAGGLRHPRRPRDAPGSSGTTASAWRRSTRRCARSAIRTSQSVQIIFNMFRLKPAERFFRGGGGARRRHPRARAARERPAHRQAARRLARSRPTTTARSTARARRSTRARRSPACPTTSGSRRSRRCARSCPPGRHARAARAALDPDVRRGHVRDPRARKTPAQARPTPPRPTCRPLSPATMDAVRAVYDALVREHVHASW